jgi:tetratricopeptide (TPR) repeat protein
LPRVLGLALAVIVALASCAPPHQREAKKLVQEGRFLDASAVWLTALEADTADPIPRKRLVEIAPDAYASTLDTAREHEAEGRLAEALATYRDLEAFLLRLKELDALGFPVEDVPAERNAVEEALAQRYYDEGVKKHESAAYLEAIASWEEARKLRPEYRDTTAKIATALHLQATADLENKRFAEALARFEQSHDLDQNPVSAGWAASIHTAWGRQLLKQGDCRGAWDHLSSAKADSLDPKLGEDLETARKCARVEVIVTPFEDLTGEAVPGTAIGAILSDDMEAQLRAGGSEHLRLLDAAAAPPPPAAQDGRRYQVRGRVTRYQVERPEETVQDLKAKGKLLFSCEAAESDRWSEAEGFVCEDPVEIGYRLHTKRLIVHLGASLKVVDGSGEQRLTQTLEAQGGSEITWAEGFSRDGAPVKIGPTATFEVVAVDPQLLALSGTPGSLEPEGTLTGRAVQDLSTQAAKAVLGAVDAKSATPAPAWLDVKPPAVGADDLQFAPASPKDAPSPEPI